LRCIHLDHRIPAKNFGDGTLALVSDTVVAPDPVDLPDPYLNPIRPMRAADGDAPAGSAWAFEFDWAGLRAIAYLRSGRLRLLSGASGRPITTGYPELAELTRLAEPRGELVLDGTIVARGGRALLRKRQGRPHPSPALMSRIPVEYMVSDVLHIDGASTLELPYRRRRELLTELDLEGLPARLTPSFLDSDGELILGIAAQHGLPGVLAKRLESRYLPGRRTRVWIRTAVQKPPTVAGADSSLTADPPVAASPAALNSPALYAPALNPITLDPVALNPLALNEAVRLAQAEVRALRAQISPHFVYNALTTISAYVRTDPAQARDLLAEFADYTRYSFRAGAEATDLGAELANIDCYLSLEQARFGDRLRVSRRVDDGLRDVVLPFLTVQLLVEHAVRHGIEGAPGGGTLSLVVVADGPDCVITVAEDVGAEPERLNTLTADLRARLGAAGHPDSVEVSADGSSSSVTVRVAR
jgi:hypothetical protein